MLQRFGLRAASAALAAVTVLSACGRPTPPKPSPTTAPRLDGAAGVGGAGATSAAIPPRCAAGNLAIVARDAGRSGGQHGVVLIFTNAGDGPCRFYGYPGVAGLDAADKQITQARRAKSGPLGGLPEDRPIPHIDVAAGQAASALLEAADGACEPFAGLLVTPPDETQSFRIAWPSKGCADLQVHPIVAGVTGQFH
ncbi:DUF4232 domain-containing protein [Luedemannella helvata]|uniref:DUF4232 domain-containing protein n=1 Tax=Luedemannella helvata TaxID=349315 RepID=A0ABN2JWS5_9ACTN